MLDSTMIGNAGEFYAMAELTRRGWVAGLTPRNSRAFDILAIKNNKSINIRIKTKTAKSNIFRWNAKRNKEIFLEKTVEDYCVLVDLPDREADAPVYYIVPTLVIEKWIVSDFETWLRTPGKGGRPHSPDNKIRLFYVDDDQTQLGHGYSIRLKAYLNDWNRLERPAAESGS